MVRFRVTCQESRAYMLQVEKRRALGLVNWVTLPTRDGKPRRNCAHELEGLPLLTAAPPFRAVRVPSNPKVPRGVPKVPPWGWKGLGAYLSYSKPKRRVCEPFILFRLMAERYWLSRYWKGLPVPALPRLAMPVIWNAVMPL